MTQSRELVLLVDDQGSVLRALTRMLLGPHFEVVGASNGELALQQVRSMDRSPSILVTDINMPGMSGLDLARAYQINAPWCAHSLDDGIE